MTPRFGHHPDPAADLRCEVGALERLARETRRAREAVLERAGRAVGLLRAEDDAGEAARLREVEEAVREGAAPPRREGHPLGGPYPTGLEPALAETVQRARGMVKGGADELEVAAYVAACLRDRDEADVRVAVAYLLKEAASHARVQLVLAQRAARGAP